MDQMVVIMIQNGVYHAEHQMLIILTVNSLDGWVNIWNASGQRKKIAK